ncbi:hypothetical protein KUA24_55 [Vibrio phage HNL01]|nr:hypothetical protein KUA24_55 [Vibrio phage HNL01]
MADWQLLGEMTAYKQVLTALPPYFNNGVQITPEPQISYVPIQGHWEPFQPEEAELLPSGTKSRDAYWFFSEVDLRTHDDVETNYGVADKIYFSDPRTSRKKPSAYEVWRKEEWVDLPNFTLVDGTQHDYVVIKEGRI